MHQILTLVGTPCPKGIPVISLSCAHLTSTSAWVWTICRLHFLIVIHCLLCFSDDASCYRISRLCIAAAVLYSGSHETPRTEGSIRTIFSRTVWLEVGPGAAQRCSLPDLAVAKLNGDRWHGHSCGGRRLRLRVAWTRESWDCHSTAQKAARRGC